MTGTANGQTFDITQLKDAGVILGDQASGNFADFVNTQ